ncbi:class 1 fructose-bisphosphatase (plasmid) [Agrobacterium tumefaciens]|uniref:fructose-1,6-bisphosphatase n=1 Tax=Agrobacterium tumefaciens TaxID=358 RepID=UPI000E0AB9E4|nr:class 1 fructose-bisphosphatase [Agrobacterium tumefaciens]WQE43531.1 class 1 fructose-bisphosphatase [Agrobacterium tumefaciens]
MIGLSQWASSVGVDDDVTQVLLAVSGACTEIAQALRIAPLEGVSGFAGTVNVQGESQKPLDILSNEIFIDACRPFKQIALAVSEEEEDVISLNPAGHLAVIFDPLDGSSNLDVNVTVGSVFSVVTAQSVQDLLPGGATQHVAGFASYGPSTDMILAANGKIARFSLNERSEWFLTGKDLRLTDGHPELAFNPARVKNWDPIIRDYVTAALNEEGSQFNGRWVASLVAETQRILSRGGLFLYPADNLSGRGRLRLLYEARPIAAIIEAAGGLCSTGREPVMTVDAVALHDRVPLIFGGKSQVEAIEKMYETTIASDRPA